MQQEFLPGADLGTTPTGTATNHDASSSSTSTTTSPIPALMSDPPASSSASSTTTTDPPTSPSPLPPAPPTSDIPAYLDWRARQYIHALNARDPTLLDRTLISPAFIDTSERPTGTEKQTIEQARAYMARHVAAHPAYRVELLGTAAQVDARRGTATVFARILQTGLPGAEGALVRGGLEGVSVGEYRRDREGRWVLTKHYLMRGVAPLPF